MNSFFRTYIQFLKRNKLYTSICLFGFAVSLTFVIVLGFYVRQELSADAFHANADRIYLFGHDRAYTAANPVGPYLKERYPQIENFVRATSLELNVEVDPQTIIRTRTVFADSSFFDVFSFGLEAGEASQVLVPRNSVVISRAFANRFYAGADPVGKALLLYGQKHLITGIMSDIPHRTHFPEVDLIVNYNSLALFQGQNVLQNWGNSSFALYLLERRGADLPGQKQRITEDLKRDYWLFKEGFSKNVKPLLIGKLDDGEIPSSYIVRVHAAADLYETARMIQEVYAEFTRNQPAELVFADREVAGRHTAEKRLSRLMVTFTALTGLILIMGIFAMSLYLVRQRAREIAVRKVNGATVPEILRMLNGQVARKVGVAFVIAVPVAVYGMDKWLQNFAYRIDLGFWVFLLSGAIVLVVTSLITTLQSWKTTCQNPVLLLKNG